MQFTPLTMSKAAKGGKLHALEWLHAAGALYDSSAVRELILENAYIGPPSLLDWVEAHGGSQWTTSELQQLMQYALDFHGVGLLQWLRTRHVPWPYRGIVVRNPMYLSDAAWLALRLGCPFGAGWSSETCKQVSRGRRSVLRELHGLGAPCTCPRS
jgi:hypothetical protein